MKKIINIILIIGISYSYSAVKVNLSFETRSIAQGIFTFDIKAQILPGQLWRVGSSNIRLDFLSRPANSFSVHPDNPAYNPNPYLHNNGSYGAMTTTSILGGTAISLNIVWNTIGPNYIFTPGTYTLGSIRFNIHDSSFPCIKLAIRQNSVLQDSLTQLNYPNDWTYTIDTTCYTTFPGGVNNNNSEIPTTFNLYNNYPNPFNPSTIIRFDIAKFTPVKIIVSDVLGREINVLVNTDLKPGNYETFFDGTNFASGIYYYRIETNYFSKTKKMILLK